MSGAWVPVTTQAVHEIRRMIVEGQVPAGSRLPAQRELAARLRISRTSLREALSVLETLGVLVVRPGQGVFVASGGGRSVPRWRFAAQISEAEVYQLRFAIEAAASEQAAARATAEELAALREALDGMRGAVLAQDLYVAALRDFEFHRRILSAARNRLFLEIHDSIKALVQEIQRLPLSRHQLLMEAVKEHELIVEALAVRDAAAARAAMERHIRRAAGRIGVAF